MLETPLIIQAKEVALPLLESVDSYPYHNVAHTLEVFNRAFYLARKEGISEEHTEDVLVAALFHDTGFTRQYAKNEVIGAEIAKEFLEEEGISAMRIRHIYQIILATTLFAVPHNICEKIIQDADLDNLGRDDCFDRTLAYKKELQANVAGFNESEYRFFTKKLLGSFRFHTNTQQLERESQRNRNFIQFDERYPG